jgi:hypothetical protein
MTDRERHRLETNYAGVRDTMRRELGEDFDVAIADHRRLVRRWAAFEGCEILEVPARAEHHFLSRGLDVSMEQRRTLIAAAVEEQEAARELAGLERVAQR